MMRIAQNNKLNKNNAANGCIKKRLNKWFLTFF